MITYIKRKIEKIRSKRSLHEYDHFIKKFDIQGIGAVEYAQWMHPYEQPKVITREMVNFYGRFITKGSLVIDIGAHTGDTTVPMALCAGAEGLVLGLEPNPYVYKILEQNSRLNKQLAHIVPLPFAATDTDGRFTFNYSDASFCNGGFFQRIQNQRHGHRHTLEVEGRNLQNYLHENYSAWLPKLSMIKVDAEGYDKEILKSITRILSTYKPVIISECNKNLLPVERFELFSILSDMGYKLTMVDNFEQLNGQEIVKKEDMLNWKHFDFIAVSVG